jgi:hypothetical protein
MEEREKGNVISILHRSDACTPEKKRKEKRKGHTHK